MQDAPVGKGEDGTRTNFQKATDFYQPILQRHKAQSSLLSATAMVIANLCVSYIMDEKNREAEELMKQVEDEEERSQEQNPNKRVCKHVATSTNAFLLQRFTCPAMSCCYVHDAMCRCCTLALSTW